RRRVPPHDRDRRVVRRLARRGHRPPRGRGRAQVRGQLDRAPRHDARQPAPARLLLTAARGRRRGRASDLRERRRTPRRRPYDPQTPLTLCSPPTPPRTERCPQVRPAKITPEHNPLRDPLDLRLPRIAGPCGLVIFGVTGDLARKKLMPAVYDLANRGLLPPGFALTGFARRDWEDQDFAQVVHDAVKEHAR